ncbi:hypothetical protein PVAP13_4KG261100 [Panicum virgatum]|uniref:Uncharacterized protein n=1 Tax=Panicum virgatum TaxID=38727 RepID=A0A8T0TT56_PANVG|nr:hypothetical protein PVAP13_4KG261100 [Panicum virgatum]
MTTEGSKGGQCFFKCPRAWSSKAPKNCRFVRWVDPPAIHPHHEYIEYLHNRIFDLELSFPNGENDTEDDDNSNDAVSHETICTDPNCNFPCHNNKGPPPPSSEPTIQGYYGEGATQFATPAAFFKLQCCAKFLQSIFTARVQQLAMVL